MPRITRKQSKSKIYHVMVRGNERKNLFNDEDDKLRFIDTLYKLAGHAEGGKVSSLLACPSSVDESEKKFDVYAYCLMDNHVHLLINEGEDNISRIMKRIGSGYVYYFNKKYGRVGHLFQDRFKSEVIEDDAYLLAAVRYIHNNPVKACMVKYASQYQWSSYNEYIMEDRVKEIINRDLVLGILSRDQRNAVELFIKYTDQHSEYEFIDYVEIEENKSIINEKEAKGFVEIFLKGANLSLDEIAKKENNVIRNELIRELRTISKLSIRQIAYMLGVDRGVVQRIKT